jgi:diguanylate cyclase (GGDEF)-like protein
MTLFSLALAYRIKKLEYEKLIIIEKANVELEEKVKERTSELVEYQEKLKELANKDHLSNLYNRRYLNEFSKNLINIVKREKNVLSVVLFDLDFFKKINDEYGHSVGDEVIKKFASILLREVRASDLVFRIGGEEFLIILLKTDTDGAYTIANKIREVCSKEKIELDNGETVCFSVSGGVSTLLSEDKDIYDTIKRADKLLYEAKKSGRDKILKFTIGD